MTLIGDHPFASHTQAFIMGLAHFYPHPYPPATVIRRKRRRKAKIGRKTPKKAN